MDGEVSTLIADIQSLLEQIAQVAGGSGAEPEAPEAEIKMSDDMDADDNKLEEIKKFLKAMADGSEETEEKPEFTKSAEAPDGEDKAEVRIDGGQGEVNEKNINEVAKAISQMLFAKKSVAKSQVLAPKNNDLSLVLKAIEKIADRVGEQDKALVHIFEGLGIAEEVKKSAQIQTVEKARPKNDPNEIAKSVEYIRSALGIGDVAKEKSVEGRFDFKKALLADDGLALNAMMTTKVKR